MATITIGDATLVGEGTDPVRSGFGPALMQRFDCAAVPLVSGTVYAALKMPNGFVPRAIAVRVHTASTVSNAALSIGTNQKVGENQVVLKSGLLLATAATTLIDSELPTVALAGAVVVETGALTNVTAAATSGKMIAGDDWYLTFTPAGAINDAVFDIVMTGDWMFGAGGLGTAAKEWPSGDTRNRI